MHPVPISDRISIIYIDKGAVERDGHTVVQISEDGVVGLPVGNTAVLMLGPGTSVTQAAIALCAKEGCLLLWTGEGGIRLYSAGDPRGRSEPLIQQAVCFADNVIRLEVVRRLYEEMFDSPAPLHRSIAQLRGLEGAKVKQRYSDLATQYGLTWTGRVTDLSDPLNSAISTSTAALYGLTEATILALGYSPSIGFIHSGDKRSFVFDVADTVKFKTVVPLAFELAATSEVNEGRVRRACRDLFFADKIVDHLVHTLDKCFDGLGCH